MSPQDPEEHAAGPQQGDHERAGHHHRGGHHRHPQARQSGLQAGRSLPDQFGTGINRFLDWEGYLGGVLGVLMELAPPAGDVQGGHRGAEPPERAGGAAPQRQQR